MTVNIAHCFFEQSGTFKREFHKLGVHSLDYDISNEFGETDIITDLFKAIDDAYAAKTSIFDSIGRDDLIIAFFPCIYFCGYNEMYFCGTNYNYRLMTESDKIRAILERSRLRQRYYELVLELISVCLDKNLRLIIENPYNAHHYWRFNFPYKPSVIDMNRRLRGDDFRKPTQYIFINCEPTNLRSIQLDKAEKYINKQRSSRVSGNCSIDRSIISSDYAHNFICDHILGIESGYTEPTLFDIY